jgi:murein DD-endopeptidase MepM/ murein hydrolase activator NlpD
LFDVAVLSQTRFVTAVQNAGKLKVIVWDVALDKNGNVTKITRGKDLQTDDETTQISVAATSVAGQFAVATRTASGYFKLYYFEIAKGGDVGLIDSWTGDEPATLVSLILFKDPSMATAVWTTDGKLQFTKWDLKDGKIKLAGRDNELLGDVTALALARIGDNQAGFAVRTQTGKLKIVLWKLTEGNGYKILHGDEVVKYHHMQHESLKPLKLKPGDKVKKGAVLGKVGNSGSSDGPHLHIHAAKVIGAHTVNEMIELEAKDKLVTEFRPLPFHGVKATLREHSNDDDEFVEVVDQGFYYKRYAINPAGNTGNANSAADHEAPAAAPA